MASHPRSALLVCLVLAFAVAIGLRIEARTPGVDPPRDSIVRVPRNDALSPHNLARLATDSPTARDLLARLERVPSATFIVRAHPRLVESERLLGRGRFWIVHGHLYGLLEYQAEPLGTHRALCVLAHELAHALEVGMFPRPLDTRTLETQLREREVKQVIDSPSGIETDFARAVSARVGRELHGRDTGRSALVAEATRSHVTLPEAPLALARVR